MARRNGRKRRDPPREKRSLSTRLLAVGRRFLFLINLVTLVLVILASLAPWVSPATWFWPSVLALFKVWLLIIPVLWVAGWLWRRRWLFAGANMLLLLLNWSTVGQTWQSNSPLRSTRYDMHVLSYNVGAFKYQYKNFERVLEYLKTQEADIICLQEFYNARDRKDKSKPRAIERLTTELGLENYTFIELKPESQFGMLVLSRYPIVNAECLTPITKETKNGIMYADLKLYGQTLRVYNMHLQSYNFSIKQRRLLKGAEAEDAVATEMNAASTWGLVKVMLHTWRKQAEQVAVFQQNIAQYEGPTLVCADLNNAPYSYFYNAVGKGMDDSFRKRGSGWGRTYRESSRLFQLRIDYIFVGDQLLTVDHRVLQDADHSDHYPIKATVRFSFHS